MDDDSGLHLDWSGPSWTSIEGNGWEKTARTVYVRRRGRTYRMTVDFYTQNFADPEGELHIWLYVPGEWGEQKLHGFEPNIRFENIRAYTTEWVDWVLTRFPLRCMGIERNLPQPFRLRDKYVRKWSDTPQRGCRLTGYARTF
jgi:hypothetical protein